MVYKYIYTNPSHRHIMEVLFIPPRIRILRTLQACGRWNLLNRTEVTMEGLVSLSVMYCGALTDSLSHLEDCSSGLSSSIKLTLHHTDNI